mmetsp:Transcript_4652/g.11041  ORF Transcript_4652/g.11041 Transcript_4652/m.11041 type:complete len:268 (+) Transcript_4652:607-1410(+)
MLCLGSGAKPNGEDCCCSVIEPLLLLFGVCACVIDERKDRNGWSCRVVSCRTIRCRRHATGEHRGNEPSTTPMLTRGFAHYSIGLDCVSLLLVCSFVSLFVFLCVCAPGVPCRSAQCCISRGSPSGCPPARGPPPSTRESTRGSMPWKNCRPTGSRRAITTPTPGTCRPSWVGAVPRGGARPSRTRSTGPVPSATEARGGAGSFPCNPTTAGSSPTGRSFRGARPRRGGKPSNGCLPTTARSWGLRAGEPEARDFRALEHRCRIPMP